MAGKRLPVGSGLIWGALGTVALQVLVLALLRQKFPGPMLSQGLEAVMAVLAATSCLLATQRSQPFAKSFWRLAAFAFFLWGFAQALGTYHLYLETIHPQAGPRGIILYFFSFTPLFAALFLSPSVPGQDTQWEFYLDFVQVLIVSATFYLLFLHVPWWRLSEAEWVSRRAATVNFRNFLLSGGFLLRYLTTRSKSRRELYFRLGLPLLLYALGFWVAKRGISLWSNNLGSWFDLGWTLPFLLLVVLAEGWKQEHVEPESEKSSGFVSIITAFLLTLALPAVAVGLDLIRGEVSHPEVVLISGAAASVVVCFFSRLMLTQYRQFKTFALLQSSEQRYRSLFDRNLAGVFRTAIDGKYLDCNEAYARIFGYASREEVLASNVLGNYLDPSDRKERLARLRAQTTITNSEAPMRRRDGSLIWLLNNVTLQKDEHGNEYIDGIVLDVTERKLAEGKILDWKNRYEAALQASGQIIYEWRPQSNQATFGGNLEAILGYTPEDLAAVPGLWRELIHPEDLESYAKEVNRVLALGQDTLHIEYRMRNKSGQYITVRDAGRLARDEQGKLGQIVGYITDVTEQRSLESQLLQSQKMEAVGRLAGGLAHDFNNLLTVIKGYCQMASEQPFPPESVRANVAHIDDAAERAASLTRHLLAFSRKQVLQPKVIDLNELIVNLDRMLRRLIGEDVQVETVTAPNLGAVKADPGQIEQVVMNLVVNARDAMPNGGRLTLETANVELDEEYAREHKEVQPGRYVMVAVSDTGSGMDGQTLARIFEPFFTTKGMGRGTGLGLSTVYGIVRQSGGHIWVYSELGHGTTFKIYLARVEDAAEKLVRADRSATMVRGTETILLVEDDEQVRNLTHSILASCGYRVLVAPDSAAVTKVCQSHRGEVDLLLTDVVMPSVSGRQVANQVSARWPQVKVLFMSGYTENSIVYHGVLDSDTDFLAKPFTPVALADKIREVLDRDGLAAK